MNDQNFVDYVKIYFASGHGGAGSVHFYRDRLQPRGGPDGGDGGRGGHIILKGNRNHWTLLHLRYRKHIKAGHGAPGSGSGTTGARGEDIIVEVPLGTIAKDPETDELLAEITEHEQEVILLSGGRGGKGNQHFKSATQQTPRYAQPGEEGSEEWIILELKVLADVGLVGFPNAGKSTLLSVVSAAKPKIGAYAFTTLTPNLGIVGHRGSQSFVMADIPGIIEGAADGKGIGLRFLRHIERNAALLFIIPADTEDIADEYRILLTELEKYNPELLDKKRLLGISKYDLIDDEIRGWISDQLPPDIDTIWFSAATGYGITELKDALWGVLTS